MVRISLSILIQFTALTKPLLLVYESPIQASQGEDDVEGNGQIDDNSASSEDEPMEDETEEDRNEADHHDLSSTGSTDEANQIGNES
jgi:hypothetical protein